MKEQISDTIYNQTATLSTIFGSKSVNNYSEIIQPNVVDLLPPALPVYLEYLLLLLLTGFIAFVISSNRDGFSRIILPAFSFASMTRRVESLDRSLDNAAKKTLLLFVLIITAFAIEDKLFWGIYYSDDKLVTDALQMIGAIFTFTILFPSITLVINRYSRHRYFYKRLHILERVQLAGYVLLLIPVNILMLVSSPIKDILIGLTLILLSAYVIHNIIVVIRYFLREKLSFYQLFLYLCTLKAAFVLILLYYIMAALGIK